MSHSSTALSFYWLWHPLFGPGYQFWSGAGSDLGELTILGAVIAMYRKHNCGAPRCLRIGKHPTADGMHHLCRRHHPDLPDRALTLSEIHSRHHAAKNKET